MDFDLLIFNGRFVPWTKGHGAAALKALENSKRLLILEGSHLRPPSLRTPLDAEMRKKIITAALVDMGVELERVEFGFIEDYNYRDPLWIEAVQNEVAKHTKPGDKVGLCGAEKDGTSYYLRIFPQWGDHVSLKPIDEDRIINATDVRNAFWDRVSIIDMTDYDTLKQAHPSLFEFTHPDIYPSTEKILTHLLKDPVQISLARRRKRILKDNRDRRPKKDAGWDIPAATGDAMITCSGHVALIKRGDTGLWGFPGGHFDSKRKRTDKIPHGDMNLFDTAVGEAFEEMGLPTISRDALIRSAVDERFFDDLNRDDRGLYITRCIHFKLVDRASGLPKLIAGDDAIDVWWAPFSEFTSMIAAFDHYDIFQVMLTRHSNNSF